MAVRIVTDSTCDLPAEIIARYDIAVVPTFIHVGDRSYLDGIEMTREEFYDRLPAFSPSPTTAAPGAGVFLQAYKRMAEEGAIAQHPLRTELGRHLFPDGRPEMCVEVTPVLGVHFGPGAAGFLAVKR